jgi:hypothetical protein
VNKFHFIMLSLLLVLLLVGCGDSIPIPLDSEITIDSINPQAGGTLCMGRECTKTVGNVTETFLIPDEEWNELQVKWEQERRANSERVERQRFQWALEAEVQQLLFWDEMKRYAKWAMASGLVGLILLL